MAKIDLDKELNELIEENSKRAWDEAQKEKKKAEMKQIPIDSDSMDKNSEI